MVKQDLCVLSDRDNFYLFLPCYNYRKNSVRENSYHDTICNHLHRHFSVYDSRWCDQYFRGSHGRGIEGLDRIAINSLSVVWIFNRNSTCRTTLLRIVEDIHLDVENNWKEEGDDYFA